MAIVAATLLGLLVGIMRLSTNWLVRNIALAFIELVRNTPQLVQIVFWYIAVLQTLPRPRRSIALPARLAAQHSRPLSAPPARGAMGRHGVVGCRGALLLATPFAWRGRAGADADRRRALLLPAAGAPRSLFGAGVERVDWPAMRGFNIAGGVPGTARARRRSGPGCRSTAPPSSPRSSAPPSSPCIRASAKRRSASACGPARCCRKVILPQALRVMVPPLTSQYLNLIKSSSLGAAVAYPELFQIFAGTVLNQTGPRDRDHASS